MQIDEKMQGNYYELVHTTSQQDEQLKFLFQPKYHMLLKTLSI
jgi:hypothetical protein